MLSEWQFGTSYEHILSSRNRSLYAVRMQPVFPHQDNSCMHVMTTLSVPFIAQKLNRCNAINDAVQDFSKEGH